MDTNDNELNASAFVSNLKEGLIQAGRKKHWLIFFASLASSQNQQNCKYLKDHAIPSHHVTLADLSFVCVQMATCCPPHLRFSWRKNVWQLYWQYVPYDRIRVFYNNISTHRNLSRPSSSSWVVEEDVVFCNARAAENLKIKMKKCFLQTPNRKPHPKCASAQLSVQTPCQREAVRSNLREACQRQRWSEPAGFGRPSLRSLPPWWWKRVTALVLKREGECRWWCFYEG